MFHFAYIEIEGIEVLTGDISWLEQVFVTILYALYAYPNVVICIPKYIDAISKHAAIQLLQLHVLFNRSGSPPSSRMDAALGSPDRSFIRSIRGSSCVR